MSQVYNKHSIGILHCLTSGPRSWSGTESCFTPIEDNSSPLPSSVEQSVPWAFPMADVKIKSAAKIKSLLQANDCPEPHLPIWGDWLAGAPLSSLTFSTQLAGSGQTFHLALAQSKQESLCLRRVGWGLNVENIKSRRGEFFLREQEFHGNKNSLAR